MSGNLAARTFSFIVIPDTQILARYHPDILTSMTRWIADHAEELNLKAVMHLGDVVDQGAKHEAEYQHAFAALNTLDEAGLPLLIAAGNHDYDDPITSKRGPVAEDKVRELSMFNQYFGEQRFRDKVWFGGVYEPGNAENMYALLESGDTSFLFVVLEFVPRNEVMEWADEVIRGYPNRKVIVITHCYMYMYGERVKSGDATNPKEKYPATAAGNDGEDMWQKHLKHHPNLIGVFSGHHMPVNVSHRIDCGVHGNRVLQCFQNWQAGDFGGCGRFRIVDYDTIEMTMTLKVFNPLTEQFESEPGYVLSF
jgi:hypothetical protein